MPCSLRSFESGTREKGHVPHGGQYCCSLCAVLGFSVWLVFQQGRSLKGAAAGTPQGAESLWMGALLTASLFPVTGKLQQPVETAFWCPWGIFR